MANNLGYTEGSGSSVASDDVAGVHYQVVKLASGTEDDTARIGGDATNGLDVDVTRVTGTVTVDASGTTVPVSNAGLTELAAAINVSSQVDVNIAASGATVPVSNAGITTIAGAVSGTEMQVDVLTMPSVAVTNAGLTELEAAINGSSQVDVNIAASGATVPISNAGITTIAGAVSGSEMQVDVLTMPSTAVTNAGLTALNGAISGTEVQVDVLTAPGTAAEAAALPAVFVVVAGDDGTDTQPLQLSAGGDLKVTLDSETVALAAGTNTNEVVGDVAHSAGAAGNPVLVAGVSIVMDDTAPPNRVDAETDATRIGTDFDGAVFAHPHGPQIWSKHLDGSSAYTDESIHAATGDANLCLYVTDIIFSTGAATACNIFFEEGAAKVMGPWYLEAVAGRGLAIHFQTPKKLTPNTALTVTTSAAIAQSIDVTGFVGRV